MSDPYTHVFYDPAAGVAGHVFPLSMGGIPVDVRDADTDPSFYLGEDFAGFSVELHSPALDEEDRMFTVVRYDGWTAPVPFFGGLPSEDE